jgi:hypothetical protein
MEGDGANTYLFRLNSAVWLHKIIFFLLQVRKRKIFFFSSSSFVIIIFHFQFILIQFSFCRGEKWKLFIFSFSIKFFFRKGSCVRFWGSHIDTHSYLCETENNETSFDNARFFLFWEVWENSKFHSKFIHIVCDLKSLSLYKSQCHSFIIFLTFSCKL